MRLQAKVVTGVVLCCLAWTTVHGAAEPLTTPRQMVDHAIAAQGGEDALTAIRSLGIDSIGHQYAIE